MKQLVFHPYERTCFQFLAMLILPQNNVRRNYHILLSQLCPLPHAHSNRQACVSSSTLQPQIIHNSSSFIVAQRTTFCFISPPKSGIGNILSLCSSPQLFEDQTSYSTDSHYSRSRNDFACSKTSSKDFCIQECRDPAMVSSAHQNAVLLQS